VVKPKPSSWRRKSAETMLPLRRIAAEQPFHFRRRSTTEEIINAHCFQVFSSNPH
jgi:hypothetical protein